MTMHRDEKPPSRYEREPEDYYPPRRGLEHCRCGSDMPGRCPGPENCPMYADDDRPRCENCQELEEDCQCYVCPYCGTYINELAACCGEKGHSVLAIEYFGGKNAEKRTDK